MQFEWKDVTKECKIKPDADLAKGRFVEIFHEGTYRISLRRDNHEAGEYRVVWNSLMPDEFGQTFRIEHRVEMVPTRDVILTISADGIRSRRKHISYQSAIELGLIDEEDE